MDEIVAVYVRVSTSEQAHQRQRDEILSYLGCELSEVDLYADVASGASSDRSGFRELTEAVEAGGVDRVVLWEISRLSRRLSTVSDFIESCVETETGLETVSDPFPDLRGDGSDGMDALIGSLMGWMMEFELQMIRGRVQSGVNRAIDAGKWVGRPPFGFEVDDEGYLQVEAEDYLAMASAVERARERDPGESVASIARACGVPSSTLHRCLKDDERASLYVEGDADDERIEDALGEVSE